MKADAIGSFLTSRVGIACLIAIFAAIVFLQRIDDTPAFADATMYIALGKAIVEGSGYSSIWMVNSPPHIKFPPGLPLLLAPFISLFGINIFILKSVIAVTGAVGVAVMYYVLADRHKGLAIFSASGTIFAPHMQDFASLILSEVPFLMLTSVLLLLLALWEQRCNFKCNVYIFLIGIFLALIIMTRIAGIAALISVTVYLIRACKYKRDFWKKTILVLIPALVFFIWWLIRIKTFEQTNEGYSAYLNSFYALSKLSALRVAAEIIVRNIYAIAVYTIPEIITGWRPPTRTLYALIMTLLTVVGVALSIRKSKSFPDIYVLVLLGVTVCWPTTHMTAIRFLMPLTPFILYYFSSGYLFLIGKLIPLNCRKVVVGALLAAIIISQMGSGVFGKSSGWRDRRDMASVSPNFLEAMKWIQSETQLGSVFLPPPNLASAVYLYSGRKTLLVAHADIASVSKIRKAIEEMHYKEADYGLIVRGAFENEVSQTMEAELFEKYPIIYANNYVSIYDIRQENSNN